MNGAARRVLDAARSVGAFRDDPGGWRDAAVLLALDRAMEAGDGAAIRDLADGYDTLLLLEPRLDGSQVELARAGTGERRHRGAFSTPPGMAAALARRALPGPGHVAVVDPACGTGALLRAALARLLALGTDARTAAASLHGVDSDPVAATLCRAVLATELAAAGHPCDPGDLAGRVVVGDALLDPPAGLDWAATFGAVLAVPDRPADPVSGWRGGFGAVIANPPWERLKVHARDWSGQAPAALRRRRAEDARAVRNGGRHPLTGEGELNAYLPFLETCWRLTGPNGRAAVIVPAGIASDRSAAALLGELLSAGSLRSLHLVEPREPLFSGVSTRIGVAVVELEGGPGRPRPASDTPAAEVAVGLRDPDEAPGERAWTLDAELLSLVNPNTRTAPLFGSATDARIVAAVHRRTPVLLRRVPGGAGAADPWSLRLVTPLHMTRDARHFRPAPGPGLVPLLEAKHVGLLDPCGGGTVGPRHWVPEALVRERFSGLCARGWLAGYRNVATPAGVRTLVPAPLPVAGAGNSLPLLDAPRLALLLAVLASLPVDYVIRQKSAGANLNFFKVEQLPVPAPETYDAPAPWDPAVTAGHWVLCRLARAVAWSDGLSALAAELGRAGVDVPPPGGVPAAGRAAARADLDAASAVLLGLSRAELAHVLSTFGALRARETAALGRFVTAERVLAAYDRLTA